MRNYLVKSNSGLDFFDDAFNSFFKPMFYEEKLNAMRTDITENENAYVMDVEIPGFDKEDLKISLDKGYLNISAERHEKDEDKKHNYLRRERSYSLSRCYYVGDVDENAVSAKYDKGVLSVEIPKKQPKIVTAHNIEIK